LALQSEKRRVWLGPHLSDLTRLFPIDSVSTGARVAHH
jgi:hypothetical protein